MAQTHAPSSRRRRWLWALLWGTALVGVAGALLALAGWWLLAGRYRLSAVDVASGALGGSGTYRIELSFKGRERYYLLHLAPPKDTAPAPLLVVLHGGGSRPEVTPALTGLLELADREGFMLALPAGIEGGWNDGRTGSGQPASTQDTDDVEFIRAVVEDASKRVRLNMSRVFATGISNGAMMSTRLACEASDVFAGIAPVAGTAAEGFESWCRPERPVAVMAFLGMDDPLVPFEGGEVGGMLLAHGRGRVVSASAFELFWSQQNRCASVLPREELPDRDGGDGSRVAVEVFRGCAAGGETVVYVIDGGGHTWPGGRQYLSPWLVGHTNRDVNASELMWEFFKRQPSR